MPKKHHKALRDSYKLVQEAHANYEKAIATATETELSPDGFFAIRQSGRVYAEAVMRYSNAAMSFLALMEADEAGAVKALHNGRVKVRFKRGPMPSAKKHLSCKAVGGGIQPL